MVAPWRLPDAKGKEVVELTDEEIRQRMVLGGYSPDEMEAWERVRDAAIAVLGLPEQHGMEREEVCHAFHQLQNYILARAPMRKVLGYNNRKG